MPTAAPSLGVIRAQVRAIRKKAPSARVFGIFSSGRWTGPSVQGDGDDRLAVYQCDSPLEMRLALQESPENTPATVLVTPLDQGKVNDDILVRLALRRLHPLNSWEIIRSLFQARQLDPRITRHSFLADLLLEHAGTREIPPVAGGLVDADTVWGILLKEDLGLSGAHPDLVGILRCSAESDLARRWQACSVEFRSAASEWISDQAGETAAAILKCLETEYGSQALAIGLVMGVVYHDAVGHELDKAAGRLESYVGATSLDTDSARRWRDAASTVVGLLPRETLRRCKDEAEAILKSIGAADHARHSNELDSGFEQRLSRFGGALIAHIDARATSVSAELQEINASVMSHRLARDGSRRTERVTMALRLARWLADQRRQNVSQPVGLAVIARSYSVDGGFVDWARRVLRGGESNKDLAAAYVRLVDSVTELREAENRRFGGALVEERAAGAPDLGLIPVEQVLDRVVAPVAVRVPVLLLLIDGMNWAVFRELVSDIRSHDWIEVSGETPPERIIGLAALPSVTEVCRTSLFCGSIRRGQASDEARGFADHPALAGSSQPGFMPKLFHKAALEGDDDSSLAGDIRKALANKKQRVVGIVINAVDDHLDKGDQIDAIWNMHQIRVLEPILAEAASAGRCVVMLSDHGHMLDRQTVSREGDDGLRWRQPGGGLSDEEIEVASARVVLPEGGKAIVPWSERLRYGPKKNGYHGGATPQEMLIPISLLWPELQVPEGFEELPIDVPQWWIEPERPQPVIETITERPPARDRKPAEPTLFDPIPEDSTAASVAWIESLLRCETLAVQKQRAGRAPVDDKVLRRLLEALASRGGSMTTRALASATGTPEHRLPGLLAIVQRVLNVEGYAVLDRQDAANTVVLNISLLKKQFELGSE
ncbi:MAG: BREX-2 system phosphatase PglZ [Phycisphaerae bacterium]|nr:BREX-2 system phosphatase PglZ [Phycisphaerae bacterium]